MNESSLKPYLLRAFYEWCTDCGYTPNIVVCVDGFTRVPRQFVRNGEIVLNISDSATHQLRMDNAQITFNARFSGRVHKIDVPVGNVRTIYAQETGQGMAFPVEPILAADKPPADALSGHKNAADAQEKKKSSHAHLSLIK